MGKTRLDFLKFLPEFFSTGKCCLPRWLSAILTLLECSFEEISEIFVTSSSCSSKLNRSSNLVSVLYFKMDILRSMLAFLTLLILCWLPAQCVELSFELEDNAKQCFYEDLKKGTKSTLEFQVSVLYVL